MNIVYKSNIKSVQGYSDVIINGPSVKITETLPAEKTGWHTLEKQIVATAIDGSIFTTAISLDAYVVMEEASTSRHYYVSEIMNFKYWSYKNINIVSHNIKNSSIT